MSSKLRVEISNFSSIHDFGELLVNTVPPTVSSRNVVEVVITFLIVSYHPLVLNTPRPPRPAGNSSKIDILR